MCAVQTELLALDDGVDLLQLWDTLWAERRLIAAVTAGVLAVALAYALLSPKWYRAEVLMIPSDPKSTQGGFSALGGLGGLASLAGISVGGGATAEPIAVLKSRDFTRAFITDYKLLPVLFADDWDAKAGKWKGDPAKQPDIYDAMKYFDENVRSVEEDKKTKLVTLAIEWKDPKLAADWANVLVKRVNEQMRQRQLREAEQSIEYLKKELAATNLLPLQQSIGRLLETELQKGMLARVNEESAFRVLDGAEVPKWKARPKRAQILTLSGAVGLLLGSLIALVRHSVRMRRARVRASASAASAS
jgi:uncharacterized protein involved in exopolysaccharide biosynthesis